jgi:hypothetical protein
MIGREDNEEVVLKVNDRRKFNSDGSLREGFEPAPEKPKTEAVQPETLPAETAIYEPTAETVETYEKAPVAESIDTTPQLDEAPTGELDEEEDFPGAEDPASFVNFLSTLATNAAAALGAMPHPATGQRSLDLETGKYWLDVLAMLKEKTSNNLHPQESRLLDGLLGDLRMQYVQLVRATEERLKQQAAQKFSGNDILGKK